MTLMLLALWIVGIPCKWYWLLAALAVDVIWITIKINFLAVLVRRSVEGVFAEAAEAMAKAAEENPSPPEA